MRSFARSPWLIAAAALGVAIIHRSKRKVTTRVQGKKPSILTRQSFRDGHSIPEVVTLYQDWTRLTTNCIGEMSGRPLEGFFVAGTLLIEKYQIFLNGERLSKGFANQTSSREWTGVFSVPPGKEADNPPAGVIPQGSLELGISRLIDGNWTENIHIQNHGVVPRKISLTLEFSCPIADMELEEEMKHVGDPQLSVTPVLSWQADIPSLTYSRNFGKRQHAPTSEFQRSLGEVSPVDGESIVRTVELSLRGLRDASFVMEHHKNTFLHIRFNLQAHEKRDLELSFVSEIDGRKAAIVSSIEAEGPRQTKIVTSNSAINLIAGQASSDLNSLRLPLFGQNEEGGSTFIAGVPRYIGVFGRDSLTTAWQAGILSYDYMRPVLARVASYRGTRWDAWRDEEPHRIPHEIRLNPKAALGLTNREVYYGDVVSTPFWIVVLAMAYNWSGDRDLLKQNEKALLDCCSWVDRRLHDGNGFIYYAPALPGAEGANRHHAWKDSGDAVVDSQGRTCLPPLALVEIQGYCYLAFISAAEISFSLGRIKEAKDFLIKASGLKKRFNQEFWMPEKNFFAFALDSQGKQVDAIVSNIGHCLGTGIIDQDKLPATVKRLFSSEMYSGWGIRTLSSDNPAYDPFSYHRGSVWPVENSTIAAGLAITGFVQEAEELIEAQFSLATQFPHMRLPEVVSGHQRDRDYPIPGLFPYANLLQAWSVSAVPFNLQVLLGLRPFAPLRTLFVKPHLPAWLTCLDLEDLRVGEARVTLRFWRDARGESHWDVIKKEGKLTVIEQPADLSPEATLSNRIVDLLRSVA